MHVYVRTRLTLLKHLSTHGSPGPGACTYEDVECVGLAAQLVDEAIDRLEVRQVQRQVRHAARPRCTQHTLTRHTHRGRRSSDRREGHTRGIHHHVSPRGLEQPTKCSSYLRVAAPCWPPRQSRRPPSAPAATPTDRQAISTSVRPRVPCASAQSGAFLPPLLYTWIRLCMDVLLTFSGLRQAMMTSAPRCASRMAVSCTQAPQYQSYGPLHSKVIRSRLHSCFSVTKEIKYLRYDEGKESRGSSGVEACTLPMPVLPPVTTASLPVRSGSPSYRAVHSQRRDDIKEVGQLR